MGKRILSGTRPTGKLHLGNYFGALSNWVSYQENADPFFMVADYHVLTTEYADPAGIADDSIEVVLDYLASGIDSEKSVLFLQSAVSEHAELAVILGMLTPVSWLERNPTYKDMMQQLNCKNLKTYGFLGYPVLQAADILLYDADIVPVGEDQLPHLELTREIARRFNHFYGDVFKEPQHALTKAPKLPGTDGRKMSKSYGNCIYLSDTEEVVAKKVRSMVTDPNRRFKTDPGNPDVCSIFAYHTLFNNDGLREIELNCKTAKIGCVDCKKICANHVNAFLEPIRERRKKYKREDVIEILEEGNKTAKRVASEKFAEVKKSVGMLC